MKCAVKCAVICFFGRRILSAGGRGGRNGYGKGRGGYSRTEARIYTRTFNSHGVRRSPRCIYGTL